MNKLIIIGNGFDLAHELKTSYNDFILWYIKKSLQQFYKNWPHEYKDDLMSFNKGRYSRELKNLNSIKEFQDAKKEEYIKVGYHNKFFESIISESIHFNWVDIESKYYSALVDLYKRLEKLDTDRYPRVTQELRELNDCFAFIKLELSKYLSTIDINPKILNDEINSHFHREIQSKDSTGLKRKKEKNNILILNFNYTSTIELYKNNFPETHFKINYIHGKLNDSGNPIIFGYGDEMHKYYEKIEQLDSNDFLMNIKSFEYFKTKNYQDFVSFIESEEFEVGIMGHSCGLSDRILLNSIFEHENCKRINIFYHLKGNLNNDYFEKTQMISRHFKANSKGEMRKRIIPFTDVECVPLRKLLP